MPGPSCACGSAWVRRDLRDGLGPVWTILHVGECRALPPPKPSEVLQGRAPVRWNPSIGTIYPHACGGEVTVWDVLGNEKLTLQCDCELTPAELAHDLGVPLGKLRPEDLAISADELAERTLAGDPGNATARALVAALALR